METGAVYVWLCYDMRAGTESKRSEEVQRVLLRALPCAERGVRVYGADDAHVRYDICHYPSVIAV